MSTATGAGISTANPGKTSDASSVTKTTTTQGAGDTVSVSAAQDGSDGKGNAVVVLQVNSDGKSTASVSSGNVSLNATGSGTTMYLSVTLNSSDTANWTVYVNTSGGSGYKFVKGTGGGGHK